jgi:hypothetical protein
MDVSLQATTPEAYMLDFIADGCILLAQFIRNAGPHKDKSAQIKPGAPAPKKPQTPPQAK